MNLNVDLLKYVDNIKYLDLTVYRVGNKYSDRKLCFEMINLIAPTWYGMAGD